MGLGEKVKGLSQKKKKNPHRYRQQHGDYQKEMRVGEVEEDKGDKW